MGGIKLGDGASASNVSVEGFNTGLEIVKDATVNVGPFRARNNRTGIDNAGTMRKTGEIDID